MKKFLLYFFSVMFAAFLGAAGMYLVVKYVNPVKDEEGVKTRIEKSVILKLMVTYSYAKKEISNLIGMVTLFIIPLLKTKFLKRVLMNLSLMLEM